MKQEPTYHQPPQGIMRFLRWFCASSFLEEIEGDLCELYQDEVALIGLSKAKRRFFWTAFRYVQPYFFGSKDFSIHLQYHLAMLHHYVKISLRHLWKQRLYSVVNIFGLAIGLAFSIMVLFFVKDETSYDAYHTNANDLYRLSLGMVTISSGEDWDAAVSPILWGPALKRDYPEVQDYCRFVRLVSDDNPWRLSVGEKTFSETQILYTDPTALQWFSWPLLHGDASSALQDPNSIVLTKSMALKYFGKEDPLGETLTINPRFKGDDGAISDQTYDFTVAGVLENIPQASHFTFDFLLPSKILSGIYGVDINGSAEERRWYWRGPIAYTYLKLQAGTDPAVLEEKFTEFQDRYVGDDTKSRGYYYAPFLQSIKDIYLDGNMEGQLAPVGEANYLYFFSILALLIMVIACINFMNLSTAKSSTRAKEVGLRKVVGAQRRQIVFQFLGESLIITFFALLLAIGLARYFLPIFYGYLGKDLVMDLSAAYQSLLVLLGLGAIVGVLAGSYPALFLSRFQPVKVLKDRFIKRSSGVLLRKGLVVFQFLVSALLIIGTLTLHKQLEFMQNHDLGFDQEHVLIIPPAVTQAFGTQFDAVKEELMGQRSVAAVTVSSAVPGQGGGGDVYAEKGANAETGFALGEVFIDYNFTDLFKLELLAGRSFSSDVGADAGRFEEGKPGEVNAVLNESAINQFGWSSPEEALGKQIVRDPNAKDWIATVIGVVKDFHIQSLREEIAPMAMIMQPNYSYLSIKLQPGDLQESISKVQETLAIFAPRASFEYSFLDEAFQDQYEVEKALSEVSSYVSFLAILIACLGLFGLAAFTTGRRIREIGIRKALGASTAQIVVLLSRDFTKLVLLAVLLAIPLAYYLTEFGLDYFAYRIEPAASIYLVAIAMALTIAFVTISFHTIKAALANPVEVLKGE